MKNNFKIEPRSPSRLILGFANLTLGNSMRRKYNVHIHKQIKEIIPPYVIISNHGSVYDPYLLGMAMYPQLINFVGSYSTFYDPKLGWIVKQIGTISKFQYQNDLKSMRQMFNVIKTGRVLGLFPTGRLSSCGEGMDITPSLVKMLIKMDVPIITAHFDGAYLTRPKWSNIDRIGRIDLRVNVLLTEAELKQKKTEEILKLINDDLYYNDYTWQKENLVEFKNGDSAEGIEKVLYLCPNCHQEHTIVSKNNEIKCTHCGLTFHLNKYGLFEENPYYTSPDEWFRFQEQQAAMITNEDFLFEDDTMVEGVLNEKIQIIGQGHLTLTPKGILFKGVLNKVEKEIMFKMENLPSLPYKVATNFEMTDEKEVYRFVVNTPKNIVKWSLIVEAMYKKINSTKENNL